MAPKRPSTSEAGGSAAKKSRKTLTLQQKLEVLERIDKGQKTSVIVDALKLSESTIRTIRSNAEKIRASAKAGTPPTGSKSSYSRPVEMERMEKMLATWIDHQNKINVQVSYNLIQAKAKAIYNNLEVEDKKQFTASSGWFANFRKRFGLVHDFKGFSIKENVAKSNTRSLRLAQQLGFSDVEEEDIDELLQSHEKELSNEDLLEIEKERVEQLEEAAAAAEAAATRKQPLRILTTTNLAECMEHIRLALAIIEENDPNVERSSTVSREVMSKMACYQLMLKEKQKKKTQQSILSFFQKRSETSDIDTDVRSDSTPTDTNSEREAESEVEL